MVLYFIELGQFIGAWSYSCLPPLNPVTSPRPKTIATEFFNNSDTSFIEIPDDINSTLSTLTQIDVLKTRAVMS